jgi:tetratricopeptide (TPR) repeat protein
VPRRSTTADDVFVEGVLESTVWAKQHARSLVISIGVVLFAALLFLWYRSTTSRLRDTAETQLSGIRQTVLAGNAPLAVRDLENFMSSFGSTPAAEEARLLLGRAYIENKEPQKAIDLLRPHSNDHVTPIGVETAMLLGAAMEAAAQPDAAIEVYLRVADGASLVFQKQLALDAAARLRFEKGDSAGAVQLYDRILGILPRDHPDRAVYELRRAEAAARTPTAS